MYKKIMSHNIVNNKIDVSNLQFEEALDQLKEIMKQLQSNEIKLQDSIAQYEKSIALKNHCEALSNNARVRIEELAQSNASDHDNGSQN
ncbi:Exodeoxyribonuclease VII small subunit [Giardia duodenalis]|uniref:Exodeoxyribonuclease VII small subunit n=1 Tax=Giardia intestinalis TaxID=5741 RepID=V6TUT8_GIAIN|nr:Exodeoxyribonuclease VII small subunit [Giardia intestinalis]